MLSLMASQLHLLLLALCYFRFSQCAIIEVNVSDVKLELQNQGDEELGSKYFIGKRTRVNIVCNITGKSGLTDPSVKWTKSGSKEALKGMRFSTSGSLSDDKRIYTSTLTVKSITNEDVAVYVCEGKASGETKTATGRIISRPLIDLKIDSRTKQDVNLWPDQSITIDCSVSSSENVSIKWIKAGRTESTVNTSLTIEKVNYETDRGVIECEAKNSNGENKARLYLRVKNPQAFVVPLIILIVEVAIVGAIVGVYEFFRYKKRQQQAKED